MSGPSNTYIVLTQEQADQVTGETTPGHRIEPLAIGDGVFVVPTSVINDPAHAKHKAFLESLPTKDIPNSEISAAYGGNNPISMAEAAGATPQEALAPKPKPERFFLTKSQTFLGAKLKIERAKGHISNLEEAIKAFFAREPYAILDQVDPKSGETIYRVQVKECVPIEFSAALGDIVHNLRSALDLLLCDLVRAAGNTVERRHGFPIFPSVKDYRAGAKGKISGVSPATERFIDRLKPYDGGNTSLFNLHRLDILDKHQGIVPVATGSVQIAVNFIMPGMFIGQDGSFRIGGGGRPLASGWGTPEGVPKWIKITDNVEVYRAPRGFPHEFKIAVAVSFDQGQIAEGEPVVDTLKQYADLVEHLIAIAERRKL
jgi:hypothetical protein